MFNNYQELFDNCAKYYSRVLFQLPSDGAARGLLSNTSGHNSRETLWPNPSAGSPSSGWLDVGFNSIGLMEGLRLVDLFVITFMVAKMTCAKKFLSESVKSSSTLDKLHLRPKDRQRLDECLWRLAYYSLTSIWLTYACFLKRNSLVYLSQIQNQTIEYSNQIDLDEYLICMLEASFYLHALYAILLEDVWRRDSPMMMIHHVSAVVAVLSIYCTRTHRIGMVAIVLRDTCDVLLEAGKLAMSLRIQDGKLVKNLDRFVKVMMVVFTCCFIVNQLYFYPLFCLFHAFQLVEIYNLYTPTMTGILTCGLVFLLLDLLWFLLILRLVHRMLFTKQGLRDVREYDEDASMEEELLADTKPELPRSIAASCEKRKLE